MTDDYIGVVRTNLEMSGEAASWETYLDLCMITLVVGGRPERSIVQCRSKRRVASLWDEKWFRESCVDVYRVPVLSLERNRYSGEHLGQA